MIEKEQAAVTLEKLNEEQIRQCLSVLETLNSDTDQIFDIPKEERIALI